MPCHPHQHLCSLYQLQVQVESATGLLKSEETCSGTTYWYTLKITFATCLLISIGSRWISSKDREGDEKRLLVIVASSTVFLAVVHRLIKDLTILSTMDQIESWILVELPKILLSRTSFNP